MVREGGQDILWRRATVGDVSGLDGDHLRRWVRRWRGKGGKEGKDGVLGETWRHSNYKYNVLG